MADDSDERRDRIHALLQELGPAQEPMAAGALLTGWVVVMEWVAPDGERWLSKGHAASTANWHAKGLHHEALYGDWPEPDE